MSRWIIFAVFPLFFFVMVACTKNTVLDPCKDVTCEDHGICGVTNSGPRCICDENYHEEHLKCVADNPDDNAESDTDDDAESEVEVSCPNGTCGDDENADTCPQDCPAECGDGFCTHDESFSSCCHDCERVCGDDICSGPEAKAGTCPEDCSDGIGVWVSICAGTFMMGSPELQLGHSSIEGHETQHEVTLTHHFEILSTEVTQSEFNRLIMYNPSYFSIDGRGEECGLNCPVENVTWHEAAYYCNRLSDEQGLGRCYTCSNMICDLDKTNYSTPYECPGYRLPTEAEWEYAARAADERATYNGDLTMSIYECQRPNDVLDSIAWFCGNSRDITHEVGLLTPNAWGLYDMLGNVWEWCHDWYGVYPNYSVTDPFGPASHWARVSRGGCQSTPARGTRAACRVMEEPSRNGGDTGFRPVRSILE